MPRSTRAPRRRGSSGAGALNAVPSCGAAPIANPLAALGRRAGPGRDRLRAGRSSQHERRRARPARRRSGPLRGRARSRGSSRSQAPGRAQRRRADPGTSGRHRPGRRWPARCSRQRYLARRSRRPTLRRLERQPQGGAQALRSRTAPIATLRAAVASGRRFARPRPGATLTDRPGAGQPRHPHLHRSRDRRAGRRGPLRRRAAARVPAVAVPSRGRHSRGPNGRRPPPRSSPSATPRSRR